MPNPDFDPIRYWTERHMVHRGEVCSVGNLGKTLDQNILGTEAITARLEKLIRDLFRAPHGLNVLDLACGIGRFAPILTAQGFGYTGVDISAVALEQAQRACPTGRFIEADATRYRADRHHDLVLSLYILVHVIDEASWDAALDVIAEALGPQGTCILMDSVPDTDRRHPAVHVVERCREEYERALSTKGLAMIGTAFEHTYLITPRQK